MQSDGQLRLRSLTFCASLLALLAACACGGGAAADPVSSRPAATCPATLEPGWQQWTNRIGAVVYCPSYVPPPITAEIDGQWNTAKAPGRRWQLGFAWLEHDQLEHLVFEGYPDAAWPPTCPGKPRRPCFAHVVGKDTINGFDVTWYDHNQASHWHHLAATFAANGYHYVVSMHIIDPYGSEQKVRAALTRTLQGLVPLKPGG